MAGGDIPGTGRRSKNAPDVFRKGRERVGWYDESVFQATKTLCLTGRKEKPPLTWGLVLKKVVF
jgi:hypothetical protein